MKMKTFLFYDIETSGLNPAFDQVLTFACIRTDTALNEISRELIIVRLRADIVPSPGAFLTHRLSPQILETGISEYQAALKIHAILNTPDTISMGYNSLGFDDEFLRFLFYRNLLDPYAHQFASGCCRMDMLPVTLIYYLYCRQALSWPVLADGKTTMKLEYLTRENGFQISGRAHEAMSDVEAVVCLAKAFSRYDDIWEYVLGFFDKQKDLDRMARLGTSKIASEYGMDIALMVSVSFGSDCGYLAPVLCIGESTPYKNQKLWVRLDKEDLFDRIDDERGIYDFITLRKKPGDQFLILPALDRFWGKMPDRTKAVCHQNLKIICEDSLSKFSKAVAFHRDFKYPRVPDIDPDADLYQGGFFSYQDRKEIAAFHKAGIEKKYQVSTTLQSKRVRTLAQRVLVRNFNEKLKRVPEFLSHLRGITGMQPGIPVKGYKDDTKLTCDSALTLLEEIAQGMDRLDSDQKDLVGWLKTYIRKQQVSLSC